MIEQIKNIFEPGFSTKKRALIEPIKSRRFTGIKSPRPRVFPVKTRAGKPRQRDWSTRPRSARVESIEPSRRNFTRVWNKIWARVLSFSASHSEFVGGVRRRLAWQTGARLRGALVPVAEPTRAGRLARSRSRTPRRARRRTHRRESPRQSVASAAADELRTVRRRRFSAGQRERTVGAPRGAEARVSNAHDGAY